MRRLLIAGNWKMNHLTDSSVALGKALAREFPEPLEAVDILVCPPFPFLAAVRDAVAGSAVQLGAQNAYHEHQGAFTGEVSVAMLADVGCTWVIVGHSERRYVLKESEELLNQKVRSALAQQIKVIFCVGESLEERQNGCTERVLDRQMQTGLEGCESEALDRLIVAYEPVWAIGTGVRATEEQAESAHKHLRNWLASRYNSELAEQVGILYGGSVKPDTALGLLQQPNVDGALVGGASLDADQFVPIIRAGVQAASASPMEPGH